MANSLFTPILNDRTRAPNFFNGRLLTGEAMSDEQRAQRVANELLGQTVGDGVAYGLEVSTAPLVNTIDRPVVKVQSGVAINRKGEILYLANDTQVQLVRPADPLPEADKLFRACTPVTTGAYIADAGVYLLTVSSVRAGNGLAQVSGLGDTPARCNVKYIVDAVEFRLLELPVNDATLGNPNKLRNTVAYQCFGVDDLLDFATNPFATATEPHTLLDDLRAPSLTDCDVPLAILYWTATGGIQWIDLWAVRRRITETKTATAHPTLSDSRLTATEAMVLQFQEQIAALKISGNPASITATNVFTYLPPIGALPVQGAGATGFLHSQFFSGLTILGPRFTEGARVNDLFAEALRHQPVRLAEKKVIRLYNIRENRQAPGATVTPALIFTNGYVATRADARFDLFHWNYASYS
jgi:hypothetical protein